MDIKKTSKHKTPVNDGPYVAIDYALSGVPQFPSTASKAQELWTDFLNSKHKEGLVFQTVFQYSLGAEQNRKMVIFKHEK